jgi:hypothetical protein
MIGVMCVYIVTYVSDYSSVIRFIEHLQIVTTSNYSAIVNSHKQQFTAARTKSSHSGMSSAVVVW